MYVCMYVCMYVRLSVYVRMHVCRYTYVHNVCVYTYMVHVQACHRLTVSGAEGSECVSYGPSTFNFEGMGPRPSLSINPKS